MTESAPPPPRLSVGTWTPPWRGKCDTRKRQQLVSKSCAAASIYTVALFRKGSGRKMICWLVLIYIVAGYRYTSFCPKFCFSRGECSTRYPEEDMHCRRINMNSFCTDICSICPEEIVLLYSYGMDKSCSLCQFLRDFLSAFLSKMLKFPLGED